MTKLYSEEKDYKSYHDWHIKDMSLDSRVGICGKDSSKMVSKYTVHCLHPNGKASAKTKWTFH